MLSFFIRLLDSIVWPTLFVLMIWFVFFINLGYNLELNKFGMHPHDLSQLHGIITMIFLHGDFDHLLSNSIPLLLSMGFIFVNFEKERFSVICINVILTGGILFFMGQPETNHIGASGLVYALVFFIITHGFFTKNKEMLAASFVLIFLYGSLIYGLFPEFGKIIGKNISWEGHLSGAISGVLVGFLYRKKGPQDIPPPEDDEDERDKDDYWRIKTDLPDTDSTYPIEFHYRDS